MLKMKSKILKATVIFLILAGGLIEMSQGRTREFLAQATEELKFLFRIEITGGIIGLNKELLIGEDSEAILIDKKGRGEKRFKIPLQELEEFKNYLYSMKEGRIGEPYPDCFIYGITSGERSVVIYPPIGEQIPEVIELIKLINKWIEREAQDEDKDLWNPDFFTIINLDNTRSTGGC